MSRFIALLAMGLLIQASIGAPQGAGADKKEAPKPLPPEIVKAWRDAGCEVGWMKDVPPQSGRSWSFWRPWREKGEAGAIPAFGHPRRDAGGVLAKLPDPGTPFGLDFHCGPDAGVTLKEFAKLKNLQSLNLGAVRSPDRPKAYADLNDLAELTNLRALYLFYMPVTDANLKHVAALKKLQVLDLSATRITDAGIKELAALKDLQWLNLKTAGVTAKGVAALQRELPKCQIATYDSDDADSPKEERKATKPMTADDLRPALLRTIDGYPQAFPSTLKKSTEKAALIKREELDGLTDLGSFRCDLKTKRFTYSPGGYWGPGYADGVINGEFILNEKSEWIGKLTGMIRK